MTVSACLIVKNEADVLDRCLSSIADLVEEIIVVDTGSDDATKTVAKMYTDKVYDFQWCDDFSAARNYAFSLCSCDFIYSADADEYLDTKNREEFLKLKQCLVEEVEIVQMLYHTISHNTVLNKKMEYRPKLFKRLRKWTWIDPIHETVRIDPVVFDSDVIITHAPKSMHHKRDFHIFVNLIIEGKPLSNNLIHMYATELLKTGEVSDFADCFDYFKNLYDTTADATIYSIAMIILCRYYRLVDDSEGLFKYSLETVESALMTSEQCYDLAMYSIAHKDYLSCLKWAQYAYSETEPLLDVHCNGDKALLLIIESLEETGADKRMINDYKDKLNAWSMPTD